MTKTLYSRVSSFKYNDRTFASGLVRNSPHKENTVYAHWGDDVTHLTDDEALALGIALIESVWLDTKRLRKGRPKLKWKSMP